LRSFGRPDQLLPSWKDLPDPEAAAAVAIPAYLRAYGPASLDRIDNWLSRGKTPKSLLKPWLATVEDQLVTVDVEGTPGYLMADDAGSLVDTDAAEPDALVCLLPGFDQYVLGPGTTADEILDPAHRKDVSRAGGWISPVVVAAGRVAGVWELSDGEADVSLFEDAPEIPAKSLNTAAKRLAEVRHALGVTDAA
jgi:hypothetical protein